MTILNLQEAAEFLKLSKNSIYSMTRQRTRERMDAPIPVIRINGNLRFSKESLIEWLRNLEQSRGTQ